MADLDESTVLRAALAGFNDAGLPDEETRQAWDALPEYDREAILDLTRRILLAAVPSVPEGGSEAAYGAICDAWCDGYIRAPGLTDVEAQEAAKAYARDRASAPVPVDEAGGPFAEKRANDLPDRFGVPSNTGGRDLSTLGRIEYVCRAAAPVQVKDGEA